MSQADGRVKIEVELLADKAMKGLDDLKSVFTDLGKASSVFGSMSRGIGAFTGAFNKLGSIIGTKGALIVTAIVGIVTAYSKLYEASKKNFAENLQKYGEVFLKIGQSVANVTGQIILSLAQIGNAPLSLNDVIQSYANFTSRMQEVKAISGATSSEFNQMYELARKLGRETVFTSLDAADALKSLSMAGWEVQDSMKSLPSILKAAQISGVELGETASIIADTMTAMGMASTDAGDMIDMMVATFTGSNTNFTQLGEAMTYASQIAGSLGIDFEDLAVASGLLANAGIKSSRAGTSLRTMLTNLSAPTENAAAAMEKYGLELVMANDGTADLNATMLLMRKNLGGLGLKEQAGAAKALFGKTGLGGGLAVINASDKAYERLQYSITTSTERGSYWKKTFEDAGLTSEQVAKKVDYLNEVFSESKDMADGLSISSTSLTKSISLLGNDGKVTSDNIESLFQSFIDLGNATETQKVAMKKYGIDLKANKDGTLDYDASVNSVVASLRGKTDEEKKAILSQIGLSDAYEEFNELSKITPKRYDDISKAIEATRSAAEKAEKIINDSLTFSAEQMASSLDDLGIVIMSKVAPALSEVCFWIVDIASALATGDIGGAFEHYIKGLDAGLKYIQNLDITGAITTVINGAVTFLKGGGLSKALDIGGEIIHQICQGIIKNEKQINTAVSEAIKNIATFVDEHAEEVGKAGETLINSLIKGIEDNEGLINDAVTKVVGVMSNWNDDTGQLEALGGKFAGALLKGFFTDKGNNIKNSVTEFMNTIFGHASSKVEDSGNKPLDLFGWLFGNNEVHADEKTGNEKPLQSGSSKKTNEKPKSKSTSNIENKLTSMDTAEIEAFKNELLALEGVANSVSTTLSSSFTNMQNSMRTSLVGVANIASNQFTNMTNSVRTQTVNCSNIVRNQFVSMTNIVRNQALNMANAFRTNFVGIANICRNQMVNCSNIVRNQMISVSNVVRNQSQNARNAFTTQFISLRKVANTQAKEARDAVTTQMISMRKVVATQSREARNAFTTQMISIKNVARVQSSEAGRYIATGLAAGIRSGTSSAVSAARSMVNQVNSVIKSTAKIASPSKITTEYGVFMGQGLGVGFKKSMPDVVRTAISQIDGLSNRIRATVNSEVAKVSVATKSTSINNIRSNTNANINERDISRLENAINSKPTVVQLDLDGNRFAKVVAKPIKEALDKGNVRNNRKKGDS